MTPAATLSTCRGCGAQGLETDDDPAPGLCPKCLEARMRAIDIELARRAIENASEDLARWLVDQLLAAGITPAAIARGYGLSVGPRGERPA